MTAARLDLTKIRADPAVQPRAMMNLVAIAEYAQAMAEGAEFPPVVVFHDGTTYWLSEGFHRFHAADRIGYRTIAADVRAGGKRDAILHAAGSNATHGQPRTNEDKRRVVEMVLADPEWAEWNDSRIGRACRVSDKTVTAIRSEYLRNSEDIPNPVRLVERNGTTYRMDTSRIGDYRPPPLPRAEEAAAEASAVFERALELTGGTDEFAQSEGFSALELALFALERRLRAIDPADAARGATDGARSQRESVEKRRAFLMDWFRRFDAAMGATGGLRLISGE